jgi:sugar phosphate isomerase/epimerase
MKLMGISDEAANTIDGQIQATHELGWKYLEMRGVEVPGFQKGNFHDIPDAAFDIAANKLQAAGIRVYCFGSSVMNWSKKVNDPFENTLAEVRRIIPRMQRLGTPFVRIMSYKPDDDADRIPAEVFRRVSEVTKIFLDAGIKPLHENCMNHGGMSWRHAVELLEKCPGLKWLFDPANPVDIQSFSWLTARIN